MAARATLGDGRLPAASTRLARALLVIGVWAFAATPALLGRSRCMAAALLRMPCPGCGMTRAMRMLLAGNVAGSLRMHPLVVPDLVTTACVAAVTVWLTYRDGWPVNLWRDRTSRGVVVAFLAVNVAMVALWMIRALGGLGGPVPV